MLFFSQFSQGSGQFILHINNLKLRSIWNELDENKMNFCCLLMSLKWLWEGESWSSEIYHHQGPWRWPEKIRWEHDDND